MRGTTPSWDGWQKKRKIGRRKVSRSLSAHEVSCMFKAWQFAQQLEMPFNRFVTVRPQTINDLSPAQRIRHFEDIRNKLAQFARDNRFPHLIVWSRESDRGTGRNEHLHALVHVPERLLERFDDVGNGWYGNTTEIDIRAASYIVDRQPTGRMHSAITYLAKNAPGVAKHRNYTYRLGGPILGKRAGWSRNIGPAAQARHEARHQIRSEFGHDRAIREDLR